MDSLEKPQTESRKISHSRNSIYNLFSWLLPLGLTFAATPFIVRGLGKEQYGLYVLMTGFIAYSFTFNIGRAITKYVAEFNATGETEKIAQIISSTFFLSLTVATVGSLILIFSASPLVYNVLQIKPEAAAETVTALYLAALCIWLLIVGQIFSAVVQATHRFDIFSLVTTVTSALLILGNVALVRFGYNFTHLVLWNAATILFGNLAFFYYAKKLQPGLKINFKFDREMLALSTRYGINVAGYQIFGNLLFVWERVVLTKIRGAEQLTYYAVPMTIAVYISVFVLTVTQNFVALTSELFARGRTAELEEIYRRATKIVAALVVFICVALAVAGRDFLTVWMDAPFAEAAAGVFTIQIITFGAMACIIVAWQFIEGFGFPVYNMLYSFAWLVISAPLMFVLTEKFGIEGTALARLAGEIVIPIFIVVVERKIFGRFLWDLWARILLVLMCAGTIAAAVEYSILQLPANKWLTIFCAISASGLVYISATWLLFYFSAEEKVWLKGKITKGFA